MAAEVMRMPAFSRGDAVLRKAESKVAQRATPDAIVRESARRGVLQRHSSWEHQLLGDADPVALGKIGAWQNLIDQTKLEGTFGFRTRKTENASVEIDGVGTVTKGNVMHILAQQLQLLNDWQDNPPLKDSGGAIDPKYQTVLVSIPGGRPDGAPLVITYGEMNTLADYYGNLDVMKTADKAKRWMVVQSVRQESFFRLKDIYSKLQSSLTSTEKTDEDVIGAQEMMGGNTRVNQILGYKFQGAMAPDYVSGKAGQIDLLKLGGAGGTGTNEYAATLGRNACHFVPESWHAWASYHRKARAAARSAWVTNRLADQLAQGLQQNPDPAVQQRIETLRARSSQQLNEALINNGFGDHYLQDSYAAGHMINKTQIMQWFVQWLDKNPGVSNFSSDENWQKVQAIAYRQPGIASALQYDKGKVQGGGKGTTQNRAMNPQAVEDIEGDDWKKRFDALGLAVPASLRERGSPTRLITEWWQAAAGSGGGPEQTGASLLGSGKLDLVPLIRSLTALLKDGVISIADMSVTTTGAMLMSGKRGLDPSMKEEDFKKLGFVLRKAYVPRDMDAFGAATTAEDDTQYQRMAAAVTYQDYFAFMNNGYLQKSTNALHDVFCLKGLDVTSGEGEGLFRVYGDDSMFNSNSSKGVKHSAETAHRSRDAIRNILQNGADGGLTTASILSRLPAKVRPDGATNSVSIAAWHNPASQDQLRNYCEQSVFPNMGVLDKAVGVMGDLSKFISKDYNPPHGGEAF
jgi:hypothetical protein